MSVTYNGTNYYYATNLQGDIIAIVDYLGTAVVEYTYDAWGNILTTTGSMADTLGAVNPLTYRGYVYDYETGFYYLLSRYYDPQICRFLNHDVVFDADAGFQGYNLFAYCANSPIVRIDISGADSEKLEDVDLADIEQSLFGGNGLGSTPTPAPQQPPVATLIKELLDILELLSRSFSDGMGGIAGEFRNIPVCFVAGTMVHTDQGQARIEEIQTGDFVWAWDEETGDVALKEVIETYVNETDELIHVFVNGEEIIATPSHPFYSPVRGWTDAVHLRAGDILVLVNGEYVVVERVQHEILETTVTVYNFNVEGYHTYYVASAGVLVHNSCNHTSAWTAERRAYWESEGKKYTIDDANGELSSSGTYKLTTDNISLMKAGYAPYGTDGYKVQLHHNKGIANDFYDYREILATDHWKYYKDLHSYLYE